MRGIGRLRFDSLSRLLWRRCCVRTSVVDEVGEVCGDKRANDEGRCRRCETSSTTCGDKRRPEASSTHLLRQELERQAQEDVLLRQHRQRANEDTADPMLDAQLADVCRVSALYASPAQPAHVRYSARKFADERAPKRGRTLDAPDVAAAVPHRDWQHDEQACSSVEANGRILKRARQRAARPREAQSRGSDEAAEGNCHSDERGVSEMRKSKSRRSATAPTAAAGALRSARPITINSVQRSVDDRAKGRLAQRGPVPVR